MSQPTPIRFFRIIMCRPGASMVLFMVSLAGAAVWSSVYDVDDFDQVCLVALFFQMFASSTGFRGAARRGYLDPLLACGTPRLACARAHWLLSVAPGFVTWLALGLVASWCAPDRAHTLLSPSAITAVVYVSTLSWAITLPFQRYVGGIGWLALIFTLAAGHQLHSLREAFMMSSGNWPDTLSLTGAALAAPVFLVASPDVAGAFPLGMVTLVSAAAWIAGVMFIARFDGLLQDFS
jgi:hypothetical protein